MLLSTQDWLYIEYVCIIMKPFMLFQQFCAEEKFQYVPYLPLLLTNMHKQLIRICNSQTITNEYVVLMRQKVLDLFASVFILEDVTVHSTAELVVGNKLVVTANKDDSQECVSDPIVIESSDYLNEIIQGNSNSNSGGGSNSNSGGGSNNNSGGGSNNNSGGGSKLDSLIHAAAIVTPIPLADNQFNQTNFSSSSSSNSCSNADNSTPSLTKYITPYWNIPQFALIMSALDPRTKYLSGLSMAQVASLWKAIGI